MINTQTQIDSLIDLAVLQRTELKQLVDSLPQLRDHLSSEIERNLEEIEPAIRSELEQFVAARALDTQAKTSAELSAKLDAMARNLESTTAAKYSVLMAERAQNATLLAQAEARIAEAASALPGAVKGIVTDELSRFPRAGEIDQLRKEFAEPRGLNPRGRWQVGETYNKLDLVSYNGDSYVSNTDGNREKPSRSSEAWTLSAARGNGGAGGGVTSLTDLVAVPANGELLIGNGSAFVNSTLTAGTGVTITNGPGTITIDASGAQEVLTATVTNAESFAITRGQVVYLFGATGNRASVKLANNSADATSAKTFGVVSETSIAAGGTGLITCVGVVDKLMLGAYNDGDTLYLGDTPGSVTATKPYAPNHLVYVGMVERANNGNGELYVKIQNGYELDEIHDVQITTPPLAGSLLMRDATNSLWKANRLTGTANQVTVTNADTSVTLSLPTAIANVNSVTAATTQNLTLAGGSTGASLVLGQGASGFASFPITNWPQVIISNPTGTGHVGLQISQLAVGVSGGEEAVVDFNAKDAGNNSQQLGSLSFIWARANAGSYASMWRLHGNTTTGAGGASVNSSNSDLRGGSGIGIEAFGVSDTTWPGDRVFQITNGSLKVTGGGVPGVASIYNNANRFVFQADAGGYLFQNAAASLTLLGITNAGAATFGGSVSAPSLTVTAGAAAANTIYQNGNRLVFQPGVSGYLFQNSGNTGTQIQITDSLVTFGTGAPVSISSTTPSGGPSSGALQVAGGIYAGAASVFGGAVTVATNLTMGAASGVFTIGADTRASDLFIDINTAAANSRLLRFQTAGVSRWQMGASSTAEGGANAGSNFVLNAYSDAGALLSAPLSISRSTGAATFAGAVTVNGGLSIPSNTFLSIGTFGGATGFKQDTPTTDSIEIWNKGLKVALISQSQMTMLGAAGGGRFVNFATGTTSASLRWVTGANGTAESGSNAGSDYQIHRYSDAGASLGTAFSITRATAAATFAGAVTAGGPTGLTLTGANTSPSLSGSDQAQLTGVALEIRRGTGEGAFNLSSADGTSFVSLRRLNGNNSLDVRAGATVLANFATTGTTFAGAVTAGGTTIVSQAGSSGAAVEAVRLTNTTANGSVYLNFNETNSTATPAYLIRYGSTNASSPNILELNATGTGARFRVLPVMSISDTTPSGGAGSGALQVAGGIYSGANSYFTGQITSARPFMATGSIAANMTSAGGIGFAGGGANVFSFGANASTTGAFSVQLVSSDASLNFNALTIAANTGAATFAGTVKSSVSTGSRTIQSTPTVTVAPDAVQNLVSQNYGFFLVNENSLTGSIAIIGFNSGGTYIVWQEGTNYSATANTASKFNVYYSAGTQLVVQNKKTSNATFNIINLAGGS